MVYKRVRVVDKEKRPKLNVIEDRANLSDDRK